MLSRDEILREVTLRIRSGLEIKKLCAMRSNT